MVVKGYTVAQLFLCQPLKTGRFLVLKLTKSENTSWCTKLYPVSLVKCTLRSVPSSDSTQWNIYLRAPEQAGWTGGAHTPTWASKHEKNFPGGLGGCASWLTDYVNYYSRGISSTEWSEKRIFEGRTEGKGWLSYLWGAMAKPCLLFIFCFSFLFFFLWHSKYIYSI